MDTPLPGHPSGPLIVTADPELREQVLLLCAAAGVSPDVVPVVDLARGRWRTAACVLVGADVARSPSPAAALPRRPDVAIVTGRLEPTLWRAAVAVGAERVVTLPAEQDELVGWLADCVEGLARARTLAVVGARGGAGASTLATALSVCAARRGAVCLVDADPLAGGVELALGSEHIEGLRWPDVEVTAGRIGAAALREALPQHRGVTVLSWSRGHAAPITADTMRSLLAAAERSFDHVVVDLPRVLDGAVTAALAASTRALLVATNDVRSVAGASTLIPSLTACSPDLRLVVRTTRVNAGTAESLSAATGLRLAGVLSTRRSVARAVDEGLGPPRRGSLIRCAEHILDELVAA